MNCRKVNSLLSAYMDGELLGVEQVQIRRHIGRCSCCHDEYESLLFTKRLISGLRMQDPRVGLEQQILARIAADDGKSSRRLDLRSWWLFLNQPQRSRIRTGALCAVLTAAAALLIVVPTGSRTGGKDFASLRPLSSAPAYAGAPVPVQDYLNQQHFWDSGQPMSSPAVVPVGDRVELGPLR